MSSIAKTWHLVTHKYRYRPARSSKANFVLPEPAWTLEKTDGWSLPKARKFEAHLPLVKTIFFKKTASTIISGIALVRWSMICSIECRPKHFLNFLWLMTKCAFLGPCLEFDNLIILSNNVTTCMKTTVALKLRPRSKLGTRLQLCNLVVLVFLKTSFQN